MLWRHMFTSSLWITYVSKTCNWTCPRFISWKRCIMYDALQHYWIAITIEIFLNQRLTSILHVYVIYTTWAAVLYRQMQTRAEGESLHIRCNTDANVVYHSSSYKLTGEKGLEIDEVYAEKIKVKAFVNQKNSVLWYTDIN